MSRELQRQIDDLRAEIQQIQGDAAVVPSQFPLPGGGGGGFGNTAVQGVYLCGRFLGSFDLHYMFDLNATTLAQKWWRQMATPCRTPISMGGDKKTIWLLDAKFQRIFKIDAQTMRVLAEVSVPDEYLYFPLAIGGDSSICWYLAYRGEETSVETRVYGLDPGNLSGAPLKTFTLPAGMAVESNAGVGGTSELIWLALNSTKRIYELDPDTGGVVRQCRVLVGDGRRIYDVGGNASAIYLLTHRDDAELVDGILDVQSKLIHLDPGSWDGNEPLDEVASATFEQFEATGAGGGA